MPEQTGWPGKIRRLLKAHCGIDLRALAALRIAIGLLILADLAYRSLQLSVFYTDMGVLPRASLREHSAVLAAVSLHAISGATWPQVALFLAAAVSASALVIGYRTRTATALSFILHASLLARNPFILHAGDSLLLLLLFWGMFLPLGAVASIDARRTGYRRGAASGAATFGLLLLVVVVYTTNALFKIQSPAWRSGEALIYVYSVERYTTSIGRLLPHLGDALAVLGWAWVALLFLSVLLLALRGTGRLAVAGAFAVAHLGMLVTMRLGLFPFISLAALLPFVPPAAWDRVEAIWVRVRGTVSHPARPRAAPTVASLAHSVAAIGTLDAKTTRPVDRLKVGLRAGRGLIVSSGILFLLLWSAVGLGHVGLPDPAEDTLLRHARGWAMFADPGRSDVWYIALGTRADGTEVDALHGGAPQWDEPRSPDRAFPDIRWRKHLAVVSETGRPDLVTPLAAHLCVSWKNTHDEQLLNITIHRMEQEIRLDGVDPPPRHRILGGAACAHSDAAGVAAQAVP